MFSCQCCEHLASRKARLVRTHTVNLSEAEPGLVERCNHDDNEELVVSMRLWETPVPIPNTMVKT